MCVGIPKLRFECVEQSSGENSEISAARLAESGVQDDGHELVGNERDGIVSSILSVRGLERSCLCEKQRSGETEWLKAELSQLEPKLDIDYGEQEVDHESA
jgi:hypothetical protein